MLQPDCIGTESRLTYLQNCVSISSVWVYDYQDISVTYCPVILFFNDLSLNVNRQVFILIPQHSFQIMHQKHN